MNKLDEVKKDLKECLPEGATPTEQDKDMLWLVERLDEVRDALEKLARLGNEPHYGNSDGNVIAKQALANLRGEK